MGATPCSHHMQNPKELTMLVLLIMHARPRSYHMQNHEHSVLTYYIRHELSWHSFKCYSMAMLYFLKIMTKSQKHDENHMQLHVSNPCMLFCAIIALYMERRVRKQQQKKAACWRSIRTTCNHHPPKQKYVEAIHFLLTYTQNNSPNCLSTRRYVEVIHFLSIHTQDVAVVVATLQKHVLWRLLVVVATTVPQVSIHLVLCLCWELNLRKHLFCMVCTVVAEASMQILLHMGQRHILQ